MKLEYSLTYFLPKALVNTNVKIVTESARPIFEPDTLLRIRVSFLYRVVVFINECLPANAALDTKACRLLVGRSDFADIPYNSSHLIPNPLHFNIIIILAFVF